MKQKRRDFLKKLSIASFGVGALSTIPKASFSQNKNSSSLACNLCTLDYYGEGPFYTQNPPLLLNGQLADSTEPGERLIIKGRVTNLDCTEFIKDAIIDVWHADDSGAYDNSGFNLRGIVKSDSQGYYQFETIKPGKYLNGAQYRPSHIHFKITAPGKPVLTTQLYFDGDTDIPADAAASITSGTYDATHRIIPLTMVNGKWEGIWDIAVAGDGELIDTNVLNLHTERGMVYELAPNPFKNNLNVRIGVFKNATITLKLFNVAGQLVATKNFGHHTPNKYNLQWELENTLKSGVYYISLFVNDIQVHTLKAIKE